MFVSTDRRMRVSVSIDYVIVNELESTGKDYDDPDVKQEKNQYSLSIDCK